MSVVYAIIENNNIVGVVYNLSSIEKYNGSSNTIIMGPVPIMDNVMEIEECNHMDVEEPIVGFGGVPFSESLRERRFVSCRRK